MSAARTASSGDRIAIVGAGNIGQALAGLTVARGYRVTIANSRGPDTLAELVARLGCAAATTAEAARAADLVVVTVPFRNLFEIDPAPFEGKILIDTNNYYPDRDGSVRELESRRSTTSSMVARHFASSRVVKAFNAIMAADLQSPVALPSGRRALPIAGDDEASKRRVTDLQDGFGYDTVDAGTLAESWRFERAKPAYCVPLDRDGLVAALAAAERDVELPHGSWWRKG